MGTLDLKGFVLCGLENTHQTLRKIVKGYIVYPMHSGDHNVKTVPAKEARQSFGQLLDDAQREPVRIERNGRPVAVLVSSTDFDRLEALEDAYWINRAQEAEKQGFLSAEESAERLRAYIHADN